MVYILLTIYIKLRFALNIYHSNYHYGDGWEVEVIHCNRKDAREELKNYRKHTQGASHKIVKRLIKKSKFIEYLNT